MANPSRTKVTSRNEREKHHSSGKWFEYLCIYGVRKEQDRGPHEDPLELNDQNDSPGSSSTCLIPASNPSVIFSSVKFSSTLRFARLSEGNPLSRRQASSFLHRFAPEGNPRSTEPASPVIRRLSITDSFGPPELHAITGNPHTIPSTGPMPKCSLLGV
jgi:hypothetical protein